MLKNRIVGAALMFILISFLTQLNPAVAAPAQQSTPLPTPTPGPDGRIIYIVQPNDSAWVIAARFNIPLEELLQLNALDSENPVVIEGQELLLGLAGPAETAPTVGPSPTATSLLPTPSPQPGMGVICVLVFDDINGDAFRQEDEAAIAGGAVSITDRSGSVSRTATTTGAEDPSCFENLPEGDYNVSIAIPEGYNPTTLLNFPVELQAGSETFLDFGAQLSTEALVEAPPPEEGGRSPILGVLGVILLVSGLGLGVFAGRMRRQGSI